MKQQEHNYDRRNRVAAFLRLTAVITLLLILIGSGLTLTGGTQHAAAQASGPRMFVKGPHFLVQSGDTTPSTAKGTEFGSVEIGSTVEHDLYVMNWGPGDLILSGSPKVVISGAAASDFSVTLQPASPVAAQGEAAFKITFAPSLEGLRHATVSIENNSINGPSFTFAIQGTGTAQPKTHMIVAGDHNPIPNRDNTPSVIDLTDFGSAVESSDTVDRTFQIQNVGSSDLDLTGTPKVVISGAGAKYFSVTAQPGSPVGPAGNTEFTVRFTPTGGIAGLGLKHATVSIASSDKSRNPYTFAIQGTGTAQPKGYMTMSGGNPNQNNVIANGDNTPSVFNLTDFGTLNIGDSVEHQFNIRNHGGAELDLNGTPRVVISGAAAADFTLVSIPGSPVPFPEGGAFFFISFNPTAEGLRHATVSIANNDSSNDPYIFAIQGTGTAQAKPHMVVLGNQNTINNGDNTPSAANRTDFGSEVSGSGNVEHTFHIKNSGTADLDLTGTPKVAISGPAAADFSVTVEPASKLAPSHDTVFTIHFSPTAVGLRYATMSIANNVSSSNPYTFDILGNGTEVPEPHMQVLGDNHIIADGDVTPSPADNSDFGSIVTGSAREFSFAIRNSGAADLNLTGTPKVAVGGAAAGDFTVSVKPGSLLAPNTETVFIIRFAPSTDGLRQATISINSDDTARSPYTFNIQGLGTAVAAPHITLLGQDHYIKNGSTIAGKKDGTRFGTVPAGMTKEHVFSVSNNGSADLELTGTPYVSISGPSAAQFAVSAQPGSPIGPSVDSRFTIAFTPTAGGQLATATVTISSNDASKNPYTFVIEGQGGMHAIYLPIIAMN